MFLKILSVLSYLVSKFSMYYYRKQLLFKFRYKVFFKLNILYIRYAFLQFCRFCMKSTVSGCHTSSIFATFSRPIPRRFIICFHNISTSVSAMHRRPFPRHIVVRFRGASSPVSAALCRPFLRILSSVSAVRRQPLPRHFVSRFHGVSSSIYMAFRCSFPRFPVAL